MRDSNYKLIQSVLELSNAKNWNEAKSEWTISECVDNGDNEDYSKEYGTCVCGHAGIRYEYTIQNVLNNNELRPIGSKCIRLFENQRMTECIDTFEEEAKIKDSLKKLARKLANAEEVKLKDYSLKMLKYLAEEQNNFFSNAREKEFILKMRRKRTDATYAQQRWINDWTKRANTNVVNSFYKYESEETT